MPGLSHGRNIHISLRESNSAFRILVVSPMPLFTEAPLPLSVSVVAFHYLTLTRVCTFTGKLR
jgi:hypothetical protein